MENKKEMTAPNVSVGADTEQPIQKIAENSIYEYEENIKSFEEMQREMQLSLDPSYLKAVSMNELFDTQYQSKPHSLPTMSAQAHHFGIIPPEKERYCILPLKMITVACRNVCTGCLEQRVQTTFSSLFRLVSWEKDWMNSLQGLWQSIRTRN